MLRRQPSSERLSKLDALMARTLARALAIEYERLSFSPDPDEEVSARERYAPVARLLRNDDYSYLERAGLPDAARDLRREHHKIYRGYVQELRQEMRQIRSIQEQGMRTLGNWEFRVLLRYRLLSESALFQLRWLGWKHYIGIGIDPVEADYCLDVIFSPLLQST